METQEMNIAEELKKQPITFSMDEVMKISKRRKMLLLSEKLGKNAAKAANEGFEKQCLH